MKKWLFALVLMTSAAAAFAENETLAPYSLIQNSGGEHSVNASIETMHSTLAINLMHI